MLLWYRLDKYLTGKHIVRWPWQQEKKKGEMYVDYMIPFVNEKLSFVEINKKLRWKKMVFPWNSEDSGAGNQSEDQNHISLLWF